ncbi:uncharacterized protein LOC128548137 [Mercenaria mercenaria]|uniref:uncharacterized protein LOC128548137 n=1 Tax=Mercenaria mercenaria TaxID=6596 RepID=UPI00234F4384|nr:uncharacterized protein LOC128548137 [Mercenaria mercenaria]
MATINDETSQQTTDLSTMSEEGLHEIIDIARYSSYRKLVRVTTYILRFIHNCRVSKDSRRHDPLSIIELQTAASRWLQNVQQSTFPSEIANIKSSEKTLKRLPIVRQLKLFIDKEGYIRCGGRIQNAPLNEATKYPNLTKIAKYPYLLPTKHPLTRLIILDVHHHQLHSGVNTTITYLRQKYWIPSIRRCVKTELRRCITCNKVNGKSYKAPDPPPLPKYRLEDSPPFTVTGVDFTGALHVKDRHGNQEKAYICLFTCASTRALHLEVVQNLTEKSFLQAFRRFCSRKSLPRIMVSDNAATFQSTSRYIRQLFESQSIRETLSQEGTQWYFIPTRAPWYGGWWERLTGITKNTLKKVLGRRFITLEELQTTTTEVEAILNDRPITYVSSDVSDPVPLTPSHLLYGRQVTYLPSQNVPVETLSDPTAGSRSSLTKKPKVQKQLIDHFRERWRHEYLTALREYHRVTGNNQQKISPGDVVQIVRDGLVRAAKVKSNNGTLVRPIVKLYPLETK